MSESIKGFIGITIRVVGCALLAAHAYLTVDLMGGGDDVTFWLWIATSIAGISGSLVYALSGRVILKGITRRDIRPVFSPFLLVSAVTFVAIMFLAVLLLAA
jgi:hypothetical protein